MLYMNGDLEKNKEKRKGKKTVNFSLVIYGKGKLKLLKTKGVKMKIL